MVLRGHPAQSDAISRNQSCAPGVVDSKPRPLSCSGDTYLGVPHQLEPRSTFGRTIAAYPKSMSRIEPASLTKQTFSGLMSL